MLSSSTSPDLRARVALFTLLAAAVFTRFYQLGAESFWLDEAITFVRSRMPMPALIENSLSHFHNPAYFMLIHEWMAFGDSEAMLRAPSAIAGVLKVLAVYVAGTIAVDRRVGLFAGAFITLCPVQLRYDQEARMYAPLSLGFAVALCGMLWMVRNAEAAWVPFSKPVAPHDDKLTRRKAVGAWLAFVLGCVLALYMHNTAVLAVTGFSLAVLPALIFRAPGFRRLFLAWTTANIVVVSAFAIWLPKLLEQSDTLSKRGYSARPIELGHVLAALRDTFVFGSLSDVLSVAVAVVLAAGVWSLRKERFVLGAIGIAALSAPLLFGVASLHDPMFSSRLLSWGAIPCALLGGAGLAALRLPRAEKLAAPAFIVLCAFVLHTKYYEASVKQCWREALQTIAASTRPSPYDKSSRTYFLAVSAHYLSTYYFERAHQPIRPFRIAAVDRVVKRLDKDLKRATDVWVLRSPTQSASDELLLTRLERDWHVVETRTFEQHTELHRYAMNDAERP